MKLIHCADLHLDSPMESNLPPAKARERRSELLSAFSGLVELADRGGASAILIAGDLFDSTRTTRKTEQYVLELIAAHPNVYFFYLAGNHDSGHSLSDADDKPQNLLTFGNDWTTYDFGEVLIAGSERPDPERLSLPPDRLNIVLLHGQSRESGTAERDVIPFAKYKHRNIDYMALGHLHAYREAELDERGVACYSGCLEGRGFDETGDKGVYLGQLEGGRVSLDFVPLARRRYLTPSLDITGQDPAQALEALIRASRPEDILRISLTGTRDPDNEPNLTALTALASGYFYSASLYDNTTLSQALWARMEEDTLTGLFLRAMAQRLQEAAPSERPLLERAVRFGLAALEGREEPQ